MPGVLNLGVLSIDTAVALLCFLACVTLDPGRSAFDSETSRPCPGPQERPSLCCSVPKDFVPDEEESAVVMEIKRKVCHFSAQIHRLQRVVEEANLYLTERDGTVLPEMRAAQAASQPPLPCVQALRAAHGPPLPLDQ